MTTSVRLFDSIEYDGQAWQVVAQDVTELAQRNVGANHIGKVPVLDLLQDDSLLPDDRARYTRLDDLSVLDTVPSAAAGRALFVHRHVYEVVHGFLPPWTHLHDETPVHEPNPDYDPANTLKSRIEAKVEELREAGNSPGEAHPEGLPRPLPGPGTGGAGGQEDHAADLPHWDDGPACRRAAGADH